MSDGRTNSGGCLRALGWGCGCLVLGVVLLVTAAYLGRDLIREMDWYRSLEGAAERAKEDLRAAVALSQEMRDLYPAEDIRLGRVSGFGSEGVETLIVTIVNPAFEMPEGAAGEPTAREIAAAVVARFPMAGRLDVLAIVIERTGGGFRSEQRFEFPVDELKGQPRPTP
jgi:hypothetical protein